MSIERVSSLDANYTSGDLSLFPDGIDDRQSLYEVRNNAKSVLKFGIPYNGKRIIVEDASAFPPQGLLRISSEEGEGNHELVYYGSRTSASFSNLIRGFAGSIQTTWEAGSSYVTNSVMAEHHNAVKDALLKVQEYLGTKNNPNADSLHGMIKKIEDRFLAPKADFRAFPKKGSPSLTVRFQSLSGGHIVRYLWDFGDGVYSIERNPTHTYNAEGYYSVKLVVYTSLGEQGVIIKNNYIKVSEEDQLTFFYITANNTTAYSVETAMALGSTPAIFNFVDQTDGNIVQRVWVFGDGETYDCDDPNIHSVTHTYQSSGEYNPILIIIYADQSMKRAFQPQPLIVL